MSEIEVDPFGEVTEPEVVSDELIPDLIPEVIAEAIPEVTERHFPTDDEIQAAVSAIALGLRVQVRSTNGEVTDTFIVGGDYAPGRSRWVQTKAFDSATKQAAELAAALQ